MKFPKLNKLETIVVALFFISVIAGFSNGFINKDYYKCCEDIIGVPANETSTMKIFTGNYLRGLTELFTGGLSSLYINFHTYSITSSYLNTQGAWLNLPFVIFLSFFELTGSVCLVLTGLNLFQKILIRFKLAKIKSNLNYEILFFYGTSLIFVGAVIEYFLISLGQ